MASTTPAERKALLFIAFVAAVGMGARLVQARRAERSVPAVSVRALERQLAVVDSARAGTRDAGRGMRNGGRVRSRGPGRGDTAQRAFDVPVPHPASRIPAVVDVDLASAAELERLPGIGPALARRIVADRDSLGPFGSLRELERVAGVGPALARRIERHVTFSLTRRHAGEPTAAPGGASVRRPRRDRSRGW